MKPKHHSDSRFSGLGQSPDHEAVETDSELEIERRWLSYAQTDLEQFEYLYRKYYPRVYKSIFLVLRDEDLATNLTDETFSRAVDKLNTFQWRGFTFGAWLLRIAHNVIGQEFRRKKIKNEVPYDPVRHERCSDSRPDVELESHEDSRILMMCIDTLKPERQEVFVNHYGLGLKVREIAIVMGITEPAVKSHLVRGREQLRKCLISKGMERGLSQRSSKIIRESEIKENGWGVLGGHDGKDESESQGGP